MRWIGGAGLLVVASLSGCGRPAPPPPAPAPAPPAPTLLWPIDAGQLPRLTDDLDAASLRRALRASLSHLGRLAPEHSLSLGETKIAAQRVRRSLLRFDQLLTRTRSFAELQGALAREFVIHRVQESADAGAGGEPPVLYTGYYEPILPGRRRADATYRYPLYRRPADLLELELGEFVARLAGEKLVYRVADGRAQPYYSRADIERRGALAGRGLELIYLEDPVERFFLQIQGSGAIRLEDGVLQRVGYAASNGRPYTSVGQLLIQDGVLPRDQVSMQRIKQAFRSQPQRIAAYLERNERFIFFREVERGPIGSIGEVLTAGRSLAADPRIFPAAALAYIRVPRPELRPDGTIGAGALIERFAFIQDSGSAIVGPQHIDLFCGTGDPAGALAGRMRQRGELYILLLREDET